MARVWNDRTGSYSLQPSWLSLAGKTVEIHSDSLADPGVYAVGIIAIDNSSPKLPSKQIQIFSFQLTIADSCSKDEVNLNGAMPDLKYYIAETGSVITTLPYTRK